MALKRIYTLGTNRRTEEDFIEILLSYGIECLIDVRSFPKSKIETFSKENLAPLLEVNGIEYVWLGRELGGFRKGGYLAYTETEEFKSGISKVESIAGKKVSVLVCAERFPWKCHRRWIARELQSRDWLVEHIIDKGKVWIPREAQPLF
jgi:uncharacterized protein (DUF488 family)